MVRLIFLLLVSAVATSAAAQTQTPAQTSAPTAVPEPAQTPAATPAPPPKKVEHREPPQTLMLTTSLSAGVADDLANGGSALTKTGFHTDADALLAYQRRAGRGATIIGITGRSVFRYAPALGAAKPMYDQGEFVVSRTGTRSQFRAVQNITYSPNYQFGALPGAAVTAIDATAQSHGDFANSELAALSSATNIDLGRTVSRRDTLSMAYGLQRSTFNDPALNWTYQNISGRLVHRLSRSMSLRTGYGYLTAGSAATKTGPGRNHAIDVGLNYSRPLAFSRRTTLNFSSGYAATPYDRGTAYNMTGEAGLTREIGQTLRAHLGVNRGVQMIEGFTQPALMNSVNGYFSGSLGRHASVSSSAGFSSGMVGMDARGNNYANWMGAVGFHWTLNRRASVNAQYSSYHHRFDPGVQLAPGLADRLDRQGVRVGLTWLSPLLKG